MKANRCAGWTAVVAVAAVLSGLAGPIPQAAAQDKKTLAWIPKATNSTFWLAVKRGAEKAGE